jgi:hypothetical protein
MTIDVLMGSTLIAGDLAVPNTGGYQSYQTISVPSVNLPAGTQILKVMFNSDSLNLNWIRFSTTCTPESDGELCSRLGKNCGTLTAVDNCGSSRTVTSCGSCGGTCTNNICGFAPSLLYFEAEDGTGAGTAPMSTGLDANASGGKYVWSGTSGSNAAVPSNGHLTYTFSVSTAATFKVWGRFLVGPATTSDDSLWARIDTGSWVQWNNIYPRIGNAGYAWDAMHDTVAGDTVPTFSLGAGTHTLEVAYRENGLKMDRFLVTDDLAFVPSNPTCTPESDGAFCARLGKNCGSVSGNDNCGNARTVGSCGTCTAPQTCGGGGTANVCGGGSSTCSFTVTQNVYDGPNWWGTISFRNDGPASSSDFKVDFDVPSGAACDWVDSAGGWTLTTSGNHCSYKKPGQTLSSGTSITFNYSATSQSFTSAANLVITDSVCHQ